jgi:hypothetical protein
MMSRAVIVRRAALFVAFGTIVTAAACHRGPARCAPGVASTVEIRDGNGALELAQKGAQLCDGQLFVVGKVTTASDGTITLDDAAGAPRLTLARESDHVGQARAAQSRPSYRLFRDDKELRVLTPDGTPLGSIVPSGIGTATIYDPSQAPLGRAQTRDRDAVVTDLAGSVHTYVTPARDPIAAGVFAIPHLERIEQLAIYLYWSR